MKWSRQSFYLLFLIIFIGCAKEPGIVPAQEEAYAVYSLLNPKDTAQYARVSRVFFTEDDPALYAGSSDSVNINPEMFIVKLLEYDGTVLTDSIYLLPCLDYPKEQGLFTGQGYFTFKTTAIINGTSRYRLILENMKTGYRMQAEVSPLGKRNLNYSFRETRYYNIQQYSPEVLDYEGALNSGQWEKQVQRLLYYEYSDTDTSMKVCDWRYNWAKEMESDTAPQLSIGFLQHLGETIPVNHNVRRRAVGVDKMIILNDNYLSVFMEYIDELPASHYLPEFSNFDKGTGILASRYYYTFFAMKLKSRTLDTLAHGAYTKQLRFMDAAGNIH